MTKLPNQLFALLLCLSATVSTYADDHHPETPHFKVTTINQNIHFLQGKGGNIAVLTGDDGIVMIDNDYKEMAPPLEKALQQFGGAASLSFIINTHWHGDHTGGNLVFGEHAHIVAHENVRKRLSSSQKVPFFNMITEPQPEQALPNLSYLSTMNLYLNGEHIQLRHYGVGHTDGDSVVFFKHANVVHMGDLFFNGFFPFVDVDNAGNVLSVANSIAQILPLLNDKTVVIPGHGPIGSKQDLVAFHDMLLGTTAEVRQMKASGASLEEMQAKGLSEKWNAWTDGFLNTDAWIKIVNASL
ncbi:MAG: MBL fold metallo-hydrolase [Pseudomonadales bacterium]|nr:MBL fold metallo-hydrolase [Pseudomonadales bacterium]MCP5170950.1 MBL fold metallo-hydrolase [Pseudomonadales bacterium]MCP5301812.1 MBL fold metallo-hydrolase [Pseudomonadales bacterium]